MATVSGDVFSGFTSGFTSDFTVALLAANIDWTFFFDVAATSTFCTEIGLTENRMNVSDLMINFLASHVP